MPTPPGSSAWLSNSKSTEGDSSELEHGGVARKAVRLVVETSLLVSLAEALAIPVAEVAMFLKTVEFLLDFSALNDVGG